MPTTHARDAAGAVAATHEALTRTRRMGAVLLLNGMARRLRIVRAVAARVEMDLGLGSTDRTENQRKCDE